MLQGNYTLFIKHYQSSGLQGQMSKPKKQQPYYCGFECEYNALKHIVFFILHIIWLS